MRRRLEITGSTEGFRQNQRIIRTNAPPVRRYPPQPRETSVTGFDHTSPYSSWRVKIRGFRFVIEFTFPRQEMGLLPTAQRVRDAPLHARGVLGMSCAAAWKEDTQKNRRLGRTSSNPSSEPARPFHAPTLSQVGAILASRKALPDR